VRGSGRGGTSIVTIPMGFLPMSSEGRLSEPSPAEFCRMHEHVFRHLGATHECLLFRRPPILSSNLAIHYQRIKFSSDQAQLEQLAFQNCCLERSARTKNQLSRRTVWSREAHNSEVELAN